MVKTRSRDSAKWVRLAVPSEFHIGIEGMAENARWRVRRDGNETFVATEERYENRAPNLLRLRPIADTHKSSRDAYESLRRWRSQDEFHQAALAERVRQLSEVKNPTSPGDLLIAFRLLIQTAREAELPALVADLYKRLSADLPRASLWAVEFDPALAWRVAACRLLFAAAEHPEQLAKVHESGERLMNPMSLLPTLGYGLSPFIEPALLVASPWLIGMNASRVGGHLLLMFGEARPGWTGRQSDAPLDLLGGHVPLAWQPEEPDASPDATGPWLAWWVRRVNILLDLALDVANFRSADDEYDPGLQLAALASLERIFAGVQATLASAQRPRNRLERMFGVVDQLNGLSFGSWENMLRPDQGSRHLEQLRAALPPEVQALALTRCVHGVEALTALAAGFGPLESSGRLRVPRAKGGSGTEELPVEAATHNYLRLIRNAGTHSFREHVREPRSRAILAAHQGDVPDGVADLAFLHLLRFLVDPAALHRGARPQHS
jgi:hypothetical protein